LLFYSFTKGKREGNINEGGFRTIKNNLRDGHWWFMPVILTWEAEMGRTVV
jgi:hypothetical protein